MDAKTADFENDLALDTSAAEGITTRAKANWESMRILDTADAPALHPAELLQWVGADVEAIQRLSGKLADGQLDALAGNFSYAPYADVIREQLPDLARQIERHSEMLAAAEFIATNARSTAEATRQRLAALAPALKEILADTGRQEEIETQLARRFSWLPGTHLRDVHAMIATALDRPDASRQIQQALDSHAADEQAILSDGANDPAKHARRVQSVADFIAANRGLLSWKVRENIADTDSELRSILANADAMQDLDADVNGKLSGISPLYVAEIQSIIASTLGRHDAHLRDQKVAQLRADFDQRQSRPAPRVRFESETEGQQAIAMNSPDENNANDGSGAEKEWSDEQSNEKVLTKGRPQTPEEVNGFKPGTPGPAATVEPIGNLLEQISYEARSDGSVLYLLKDRPAFIDHGDHLTMAPGASAEERAILAALLLAKEKYAGNFELTGDDAFQSLAIGIMAKYAVQAQLKNPAQAAKLREATERMLQQQKTFAPGTPERPVQPTMPQRFIPPPEAPPARPGNGEAETGKAPPIPLASNSNIESNQTFPAPDGPTPAAAPPRQFSEGKVINHGKARFEHKDRNNLSYFVELEDQKGQRCTTWGVDLQRAMAVSNTQIGDQVVLRNLGKKPVDVQRLIHDADGNAVGTEWIPAVRVNWEIERQMPRKPVSRAREASKAIASAPPAMTARDTPAPSTAKANPSPSEKAARRQRPRLAAS